MKKVILLLVVIISTTTMASAQLLKFGAKAGVNMNSTDFALSDVESADYVLEGVTNNAGYHVGISTQVNLIGLYVQGDALFVHDAYSYTVSDNTIEVKESRLDIPVVVGLRLLFFRLYAGPRFSIALGENFKETVDNVSSFKPSFNNEALAYQAGVGIDIFSHFTLDLNYNGYFKAPTQTIFIDTESLTVKNKNKQFWLSLGYNF